MLSTANHNTKYGSLHSISPQDKMAPYFGLFSWDTHFKPFSTTDNHISHVYSICRSTSSHCCDLTKRSLRSSYPIVSLILQTLVYVCYLSVTSSFLWINCSWNMSAFGNLDTNDLRLDTPIDVSCKVTSSWIAVFPAQLCSDARQHELAAIIHIQWHTSAS